MFDQQVKKADMRAVFTENARNMNSYDPCAADPLSHEELQSLGVFWFSETPPDFIPGRGHRPIVPTMGGARDVLFARMHVRDDPAPSDIRQQMNLRTADAGDDAKWWQKLWTS